MKFYLALLCLVLTCIVFKVAAPADAQNTPGYKTYAGYDLKPGQDNLVPALLNANLTVNVSLSCGAAQGLLYDAASCASQCTLFASAGCTAFTHDSVRDLESGQKALPGCCYLKKSTTFMLVSNPDYDAYISNSQSAVIAPPASSPQGGPSIPTVVPPPAIAVAVPPSPLFAPPVIPTSGSPSPTVPVTTAPYPPVQAPTPVPSIYKTPPPGNSILPTPPAPYSTNSSAPTTVSTHAPVPAPGAQSPSTFNAPAPTNHSLPPASDPNRSSNAPIAASPYAPVRAPASAKAPASNLAPAPGNPLPAPAPAPGNILTSAAPSPEPQAPPTPPLNRTVLTGQDLHYLLPVKLLMSSLGISSLSGSLFPAPAHAVQSGLTLGRLEGPEVTTSQLLSNNVAVTNVFPLSSNPSPLPIPSGLLSFYTFQITASIIDCNNIGLNLNVAVQPVDCAIWAAENITFEDNTLITILSQPTKVSTFTILGNNVYFGRNVTFTWAPSSDTTNNPSNPAPPAPGARGQVGPKLSGKDAPSQAATGLTGIEGDLSSNGVAHEAYYNGDNAPTLSIYAGNLTGFPPCFVLAGQQGMVGADGQGGGAGGPGQDGKDSDHLSLGGIGSSCSWDAGSGGTGGQGGAGGSGGHGSNGGKGGALNLFTTSTSAFGWLSNMCLHNEPGRGGGGGQPGSGGPGGSGGKNGHEDCSCHQCCAVSFTGCGGTVQGATSPACPDGCAPNGQPGPSGSGGSAGINAAFPSGALLNNISFVQVSTAAIINDLDNIPRLTDSLPKQPLTPGDQVIVLGANFAFNDTITVWGSDGSSHLIYSSNISYVTSQQIQFMFPEGVRGPLATIGVQEQDGTPSINNMTVTIKVRLDQVVSGTPPYATFSTTYPTLGSPSMFLPNAHVLVSGIGFFPQMQVLVGSRNGSYVVAVSDWTFINETAFSLVLRRPQDVNPAFDTQGYGQYVEITVATTTALVPSPEPLRTIMDVYKVLVMGDSVMWSLGVAPNQKGFVLLLAAMQRFFADVYNVDMTVTAQSGANLVDNSRFGVPGLVGEIATSCGPGVNTQAKALVVADATGKAIPNPFVKLVMMDGCANDVGLFNILPMYACNFEGLQSKVNSSCYGDMLGQLGQVASLYPNAQIIVSGYYVGVALSNLINDVALDVMKLILIELPLEALAFPLDPLTLIPVVNMTLQNLLQNCWLQVTAASADAAQVWFWQTSEAKLQQAVADFNAQRDQSVVAKAAYASSGFLGLQNAAYGPSPFVNEVEFGVIGGSVGAVITNDELYAWRQENCPIYQARSCPQGSSKQADVFCPISGLFHPNVQGAFSYTQGFAAALQSLNWCESQSTLASTTSTSCPPVLVTPTTVDLNIFANLPAELTFSYAGTSTTNVTSPVQNSNTLLPNFDLSKATQAIIDANNQGQQIPSLLDLLKST